MLKIDIISGFLGAGKTTFIQRLLKTDLKKEKIVLIENEFGEISVDSKFLSEAKIDIAEKVSFNIGGKKYNIDKDEFFKLADEIKVENVKNNVLQQTDDGENSWQENMIFITVDLKEGHTVYKGDSPFAMAAISKYGEVSHNAVQMSLLPSKDYQMEIEDVAKLYKLLPLEVSAKYVEPTVEEKTELNNRNNIIAGVSGITIVVLGLIVYLVFKKKARR